MMINMKLKLLPLLFSFLLINTSVFAAIYPQHLLDNPNYQLVYALMDHAVYIDMSSAYLKYNSSDDFIIAVNETDAAFIFDPSTELENLKSIKGTNLVWYYKPLSPSKVFTTQVTIDSKPVILPPYIGEQYAYYSLNSGDSWMPFDIYNTAGPMRLRSKAFILLVNKLSSK